METARCWAMETPRPCVVGANAQRLEEAVCGLPALKDSDVCFYHAAIDMVVKLEADLQYEFKVIIKEPGLQPAYTMGHESRDDPLEPPYASV